MNRLEHWQALYRRRSFEEVGFYEADPATSLALMGPALEGARSVLDVGGGASFLVDRLLDQGVEEIAVLDISEAALDVARRRLGDQASLVRWIVGDVTDIAEVGTFDVWHDRAVFHFLTDPSDRRAYVRLAERTLEPGSTAIVATFAPDAPAQCSGLDVCGYDAEQLAEQCGPGFELVTSRDHMHTTPRGVAQHFQYAVFRRVAPVLSASA